MNWAEKNRPQGQGADPLDGVYSAASCFPALPLSVEAAQNPEITQKTGTTLGVGWVELRKKWDWRISIFNHRCVK